MTDIVKTAQRILKALHHQCVMADAIREQDPIAKAGDEGGRTKRSDNSRDLPTGTTTVTQVV